MRAGTRSSRAARAGAALALLAVAAASAAAAGSAAPEQPPEGAVAQESNPFTDQPVRAPPFIPQPGGKISNLYEIPELPDRFEAFFRYDNRVEGRWVYNFRDRKTLVELFTGGAQSSARSGFFSNYEVLEGKMHAYDTAGSPGGERCAEYDFVRPYSFMFSPRSWRKIDVSSIDFVGMSPLESQRQTTSVAVAGIFDSFPLQFSCYTNGTIRRISIGRHHWAVHRFTDLSSLDREAWEATDAFRDLRPPEMGCTNAGGINSAYYYELQAKLPYMLFKPTQWPAMRKLAARIRELELEGHPQAAEALSRSDQDVEQSAAASAEGAAAGNGAAPAADAAAARPGA